jgi:hypothetical protein
VTVRRVVSVIFFIFGTWILSAGIMMAWLDLRQGLVIQLFMFGFFGAISGIFLLLGAWASPGSGLRELGLTLLISAGIGGSSALAMALFLIDPSFRTIVLADQRIPDVKLAPLSGAVTLLLVGGLGWLLYRRAAVTEH